MGAFEQALRQHFESSRGHPQYQVWLDYALSSNQRGAELAEKLRHWVPDYRGRRTLDVGSGYGGSTLAFARAGADAVGLEVDATLHRLSLANAAEHPGLKIDLRHGDAMRWEQLAGLGRFDVVTVDNVIEHVPVPQVALAHVRRLLADDGVAWLTAPNAFSFGQIVKECHYGRFGLSLLDPIDGERYMGEALGVPSYDVSSYFPYDGYLALFARYGLHAKLLNPVAAAAEEVAAVRARKAELEQARATADVPAGLRPKVERLLGEHLARCEGDLAYFDNLTDALTREEFGHRLYREYVTELWYFVLSPTAARLEGAPAKASDAQPAPAPAPLLADPVRAGRRVASQALRLANEALMKLQSRVEDGDEPR